MTIDKYEYIQKLWEPRKLMTMARVDPQYIYTLKPLRRVQVMEDEEEDCVALIQRRCW